MAGAFASETDEGRAGPAGPIDEQPDGVVLPQGRHRNDRLGGRRRQRLDSPRHLAGDPERLACRREHVHGRVLRQERGRERGARLQEVLAVVEDEQRSFLGQRGDHLLDGLQPGDVMGSHRGQHRRSDPRRVGHARELHEPDSARELLEKLGRHRRARDASCPLLLIPST